MDAWLSVHLKEERPEALPWDGKTFRESFYHRYPWAVPNHNSGPQPVFPSTSSLIFHTTSWVSGSLMKGDTIRSRTSANNSSSAFSKATSSRTARFPAYSLSWGAMISPAKHLSMIARKSFFFRMSKGSPGQSQPNERSSRINCPVGIS